MKSKLFHRNFSLLIAGQASSLLENGILDFPLSARIPPRGENKMEGIIEAVRNPAYTAADPVFSRTYMDMAKSRIPFPRRELACPAMRREKFLWKSFGFIILFLSNMFYIYLIYQE